MLLKELSPKQVSLILIIDQVNNSFDHRKIKLI